MRAPIKRPPLLAFTLWRFPPERMSAPRSHRGAFNRNVRSCCEFVYSHSEKERDKLKEKKNAVFDRGPISGPSAFLGISGGGGAQRWQRRLEQALGRQPAPLTREKRVFDFSIRSRTPLSAASLASFGWLAAFEIVGNALVLCSALHEDTGTEGQNVVKVFCVPVAAFGNQVVCDLVFSSSGGLCVFICLARFGLMPPFKNQMAISNDRERARKHQPKHEWS